MTSIILYTRGRFCVNQTLSWLFKDIFPPKKNNLPHLNLSTLYQACWRLHCMCQWWKHPYLERHHVVPALSVCWWSQSSQSFPPKRYINTVTVGWWFQHEQTFKTSLWHSRWGSSQYHEMKRQSCGCCFGQHDWQHSPYNLTPLVYSSQLAPATVNTQSSFSIKTWSTFIHKSLYIHCSVLFTFPWYFVKRKLKKRRNEAVQAWELATF